MTTPDREQPLARLLVHPRTAHARVGEPVTFGVPFPRGRVADAGRLALVAADGRVHPSSARATERWSDGSLRWALVDAAIDVPAEGTALTVREAAPAEHPTPLVVQCDGRVATVASAGFVLDFDVASRQGLMAVTLDGAPALAEGGVAWRIADAEDRECAITWREIAVESATPLAATVVLRGVCVTAARRMLHLSMTCRVFAGRRAVAIDVELHNPSRAQHPGGFWELGDAGSILLHRADLQVCRTRLQEGTDTRRAGLQACRASLDAAGHFTDCALPFDLTQHSSGGAHWNSPVHVTADGTLPFTHRGYTLRAGDVARDGLRAEPTVVVGDGASALTITAPRFWQVFPKALRVSAEGVAEVAWLPAGTHPHEIQGGERCHFAFGVGFGGDDVTSAPLEWLRATSVVLPDPETAAAAEAVPRLVPAARAADPAYDALVSAALEGDDTFEHKRERIDEYGWRHFGDLYADHENGGDAALLRVSHYNNQYDAVAGFITQALRTGDPRWWILADDLAAHLARIDVYWTEEDKAAYSGGLFWHTAHYVDAGRSTHRTYPKAPGVPGGGPSNEHCYTTGLLLHHRMTGHPLSGAAVARLARWMTDADDGAKAPVPLRWLSHARTGYASATRDADYHGPGRGAANAVRAMLDALRATGDDAYLAKARELVRRVVHPQDDIPSLQLDDPERRWSYTVMLQVLGRYIDDLDERGGHEDAVGYARASLLHYARWMAEHEYPYLEKPERLEFPTETWAAQDLRKAVVLGLAAEHAADPSEQERFIERAEFFHRIALDTLARMATRATTRPVVLLLVNGFTRGWHRTGGELRRGCGESTGSWPVRAPFVAQRTIAVRRMAWAVVVAAVALMGLALLLVSLLA